MTAQPPKDVYLTFAGLIDQHATGRIFGALDAAVNNGVEMVHLLVQSLGGVVDDGIAVHNFITNLPLKVITYNEGTVQSIAVLLSLAGQLRKCSANASFLIHKSTFPFQNAVNAEMMRARAEAVESGDQKIDAILRSHMKMPDAKWTMRDRMDLLINADEAKEFGLIHEIAHFAPPLGCQIFNI